MEELGKVLTELIRAGREVSHTALIGYFAWRVLEVIAWPCMWFGISLSVIKVIGLRVVDGWRTMKRAQLMRANAEMMQQLLSAELLVERRSKESESYTPPKWYAEATTWCGEEFTT